MGAVAALLYLSTKAVLGESKERVEGMGREMSVIGGIYDSPFYSLEKLTLELGSRSSNLPEVLLRPVVFLLKTSLRSELDFGELELEEKVREIKVPGMFVASQRDSFVHHSHSETLYKEYGGKKELIYIEKDHNQMRRGEDLSPVYAFLRRLNQEHPRRCHSVLAANLAYQRTIKASTPLKH